MPGQLANFSLKVGTHSDATPKERVEVLQAELSQRVPGIEFIPVSCLSKSSILLLQNAIILQAQKAGLIGAAIPANFKNVQKTLRDLNLSLIPWQRFQSILEQVCSLPNKN